MTQAPAPGAPRKLLLICSVAVMLIPIAVDLVLPRPAAADNCGDISDCFPSAKGILFALAAVLIVVGILALLSGGPGLLALLAAAAETTGGGGLALAGGGVLAEAGVVVTAAGAVEVVGGVAAIATGTHIVLSQAAESGGSSGSDGQQGGSSGGSGSGGGSNLSSRPGQIADRFGRTTREVRDAIHAVKRNMPRSGPTRNPDVMVDLNTGEVYPQLPGGAVGDSIGNILEFLPGGG